MVNRSDMVIVGAALPRTGTMSVKRALEILGFAPSYHMHEVFRNPNHLKVWRDASQGILPDWRAFLGGYASTLDFPACLFWQHIFKEFPKAKVLLLLRDPNDWYESVEATIYQVAKEKIDEPTHLLVRQLFFGEFLKDQFENRSQAMAVFEKYCTEVKSSVNSTDLVEYSVSEGWGPLCKALSCPVPEEPFPMTNTRPQFRARNRQ